MTRASSRECDVAKVRPRIYVASLSDYNAGRLYGRWIDAAQAADAVRDEIASVLASSQEPGAEEWAIHDYEGFGPLRLGEWEEIERVTELARLIAEHGTLFAALAEHIGGMSAIEEAREFIECAYRGEYDDVGSYAACLGEDLYHEALLQLPGFIRFNIDWDAIGRDLLLSGDIFTVEHGGQVHVFDGTL